MADDISSERRMELKKLAQTHPQIIETGAEGVIPFIERHYKGRPLPPQAEISYLEAFLRGERSFNR